MSGDKLAAYIDSIKIENQKLDSYATHVDRHRAAEPLLTCNDWHVTVQAVSSNITRDGCCSSRVPLPHQEPCATAASPTIDVR